jgi:hypothetical protein
VDSRIPLAFLGEVKKSGWEIVTIGDGISDETPWTKFSFIPK